MKKQHVQLSFHVVQICKVRCRVVISFPHVILIKSIDSINNLFFETSATISLREYEGDKRAHVSEHKIIHEGMTFLIHIKIHKLINII